MSKVRKPIDKAHIKDLLKEKDVFLTTSERAYEYFLRNTKLLAAIGIGLLLVIVAVTIYINHRRAIEVEASTAYDKAYEMMAADSPSLTAVIGSMEKVKKDYAGNKASRMAMLTLISLYSESKDYEKAIGLGEEFLQSIKSAEISLKPILLYRLAELYELNKSYDKSISAYEALLATDSQQNQLEKPFKADLLMALGRVKLAKGDKEGAKEAYEKVINEAPGSVQAYLSNYKLVEISGTPRSVHVQDIILINAENPQPASEEKAADSIADSSTQETGDGQADVIQTDSDDKTK